MATRKHRAALNPKDIRYWCQVPVDIHFHYLADGEERVLPDVLNVPMTDQLLTDLETAHRERNIPYEFILQESMQDLLTEVQDELRTTLPPEQRENCVITIKVTGAITRVALAWGFQD